MATIFELLSAYFQESSDMSKCVVGNARCTDVVRAEILTSLTFPGKSLNDSLYIMRTSLLAESAPYPLPLNSLFLEDVPLPVWVGEQSDRNWLLISGHITPEAALRAFTLMHDQHYRLNHAADRIMDALYYGRGLQSVVDIVAETLGNPTFLQDASMNGIAISKTVQTNTPAILKDVQRGYLDNSSISYLKNQQWLRALDRSGPAVIFQMDDLKQYIGGEHGYNWCKCQIKVNHVVVAYLDVFGEYSPIPEYCKGWIIHIAKLVSMELQKGNRFSENRGALYETFLTELLEGKITDRLVVIRRLDLLERKLDGLLRVIVIEKLNGTDSFFTHVEENQLRHYFPNCISMRYCGNVVILTSSADGNISRDRAVISLNEHLAFSGLVAGVSNVFTDLTDLRRYYLQAIHALKFGRSSSSVGGTFPYVDYAVFHALEICTEKVDLRDLCHPCVLALQESELPADRDAFQTLYLYLLYMKDVKRVTKALNIHKSTLFYRINKLKTIYGLDYEDGNTVFHLLFSFKLVEYMDIFASKHSPPPSRAALPHNASGSNLNR